MIYLELETACVPDCILATILDQLARLHLLSYAF